jgi:hypothetical protein
LKYSYGENQRAALTKAEHIAFNALFKDSSLLLENGIGIDKNSKYRGQRVEVVIQLPIGKKIRFDERLINAYAPFELDINEDGFKEKRAHQFEFEPGVEYIMTEEGLEKAGGEKNKVIKDVALITLAE